jgi:hypothetical protein
MDDIEEIVDRMFNNFPDCEDTQERQEEIGIATVELLALLLRELRKLKMKGGDLHEHDLSVQQEGDPDPLSQPKGTAR